MVQLNNFDDIRPFNDSEVNPNLQLLLRDKQFENILQFLFQDKVS